MAARRGLYDDLFDKQQAFIDDPSKRKGALCTRRAGKTHVLVRYMFRVAGETAKCKVVYIALSRTLARDLIWQDLKDAAEKYKLAAKFFELRLEVKLPNGSTIWLRGADDARAIERMRGFAFNLAVLDEAASFGPHFERLIREILSPTLKDYGGTLVMVGTPSPRRSGLFYEATRGVDPSSGWSIHGWSVADNKCFPRWWTEEGGLAENWEEIVQELFEEAALDYPLGVDDPGFQREWMRRWVADDSALVYRWDPKVCKWTIPEDNHNWMHIIGLDLGSVDKFAAVVWKFCADYPDAWVAETYSQSGLDVTDCADVVKDLSERYNPISTVADTGGLGKQIVDEMVKRHNLNIQPAEKSNKPTAIQVLNTDMRRGHIHAEDGPLSDQWVTVQWAVGKIGILEDPTFPNDLTDAALYGHRECLHYLHRPKTIKPPIGTAEWGQREEERMRRARIKFIKGRRRG